MNKFISIIFVLFTLNFSNVIFAANYIEGTGIIQYVVDGDTKDIKVDDFSQLEDLYNNNIVGRKWINTTKETFRVRLANTNTEESKHKDNSKNTSFGQETSKVVKSKYTGKRVKYICYKKGYYERAICDLYVNNENIGAWLISNNYSPYVTKFGKHPTLHQEFSNLSNGNTEGKDYKNYLSYAKKPSKKKAAKAVYNYFMNRDKSRNQQIERREVIDYSPAAIQGRLLQMKNFKNNPKPKQPLTQEQVVKLKWLDNLNYN